jgi:HSP20 family protein
MAERQHAITPTGEERRVAKRTATRSPDHPFTTLQRIAEDMERMFAGFGVGRRGWMTPLSRGAQTAAWWAPEVDVYLANDQLVIKADLPGLAKDEVSVDVSDDAVTIEGQRRSERQEEDEGYFRSERSYGSFCRVIPLPEGAITEQAKATFRDGVLEITMPAPPATTKGRRLEISEGEGAKK